MNNIRKDALNDDTALGGTLGHARVLAVRLGRGRTGGSTILDLLIQLARAAGRNVLICDGDRRNPSLAGLYPPGKPGGASQPQTDELADAKEWMTNGLGEAVKLLSSIVFDMGAGDKTMQDLVRDLNLDEFCQACGMEPLGLFSCGPDMDDFEHILSIWQAGYFRPARSLLILNEHLVPQGRTPRGAFDAIMGRPEFLELGAEGVETIMLPRLPCMEQMRKAGLGFVDAASGRPGSNGIPLDPVRQFMVKQWVSKIVAQLETAGALGWCP